MASEYQRLIKFHIPLSIHKRIIPRALLFFFCQSQVVFAMSFRTGVVVSGRSNPIWLTVVGVVKPAPLLALVSMTNLYILVASGFVHFRQVVNHVRRC